MDYKNLYKRKYIYRIYESNGKIHCEKHPIIYLNYDWVYFKVGRNSRLNCVSQSHVNDLYTTTLIPKYYRWYKEYFFGNDKEIKKIVEDLVQQKTKEKDYSRYEKAKKEFEEALTAIEVIEQLKLKIKEEENNGNSKN